MRYLSKYLSFVCLLLCASATSVCADELSVCLEKGKKEFAQKNYLGAQAQFGQCVKMDPNSVDANLSLAGVLLTQDDLDGANTQFLLALQKMKRSSPYLSYTYSILGDIALKKKDYKSAAGYYDRSLWFNAANVNSLVGKGVITEYQGNKVGASDLYRTALAVEPLNVIARKRLINLEPIYFSDAELLDALKQRYAVLPAKTELSDQDRELFTKIHGTEQRGGLEYLKNKYPRLPADYTAVLFKGTGFEREVLTLSGFTALQKQIGQDAITVFQKIGVRVQDVFDLRDMKGNKIFLLDSTLTDRGFFVYTEALQGRKAFLLPQERVPPTAAFLEQTAKRVQDLLALGYIEISPVEVKAISAQTQCSEDTLRKKMGLYLLDLGRNDKRYFVLARELPDDKHGVAYYFLMQGRARKNPNLKVPRNNIVDSYLYTGYTVCASDGSDWD